METAMTQTLNGAETPPFPAAPGASRVDRAARHAACERLDDQALLSLMLARSEDDPDTLSASLMRRFGSLGAVAAADPGELLRAGDLGQTAVGDLKILRELAIRLARIDACRRPVIASWSALLAYVRAALAHQPREQFRALFLDHRNNLIQDELVANGTTDHAPVYPREVVRRALEVSASAMILVHNHPSGNPEPSRADIEMTRQIVEAARLFSLQVHDHLVIGRDGTASFRQLGLI
jgi:DNA repair protein RadC